MTATTCISDAGGGRVFVPVQNDNRKTWKIWTVKYYEFYIKSVRTKKQITENPQNVRWRFPHLQIETHAKSQENWISFTDYIVIDVRGMAGIF